LTEPTGEVWLLPVGPGEARRIGPPNLFPDLWSSFLSDGERIVYEANEAGRPVRTWLQDLKQGNPRPITDEGTAGWLVSPDDKWLLAGSGAGYPRMTNPVLVPIAGGSPVKVPGVQPNDSVLGWSSDGQLYVQTDAYDLRGNMHVQKLNPHTGARTAWRELSKPTVGGVYPQRPFLTPDGASYFYGYTMELYDLYTVSGVR
jgi:eukaryotic-like serine/threonine-protein kinase